MAATGAGKFRHLIVVQKMTRTRDDVGGWVESWEDDFSVWAAMWPTSAAQLVRGDKLEYEATMRFRFWYNPRVTYLNRIRYGDRYFRITSIIVPDEARKYTDVLAVEVQNV